MAFVSADILCVPRSVHPSLELYRIPLHSADDAASTNLQYSCALDLPRLDPSASISIEECRLDPRPIGRMADSHPFRYSSSETIMSFNMLIHIPFLTTPYSLIMHRRSLLAHLFQPNCGPYSELDKVPKPDPIPWQDWGPANTRWFSTQDMPSYLITTTSGQRYVQTTFDVESPIRLLDFNRFNVRRMSRFLQVSSPSAMIQPVTERSIFSERGVFVDEVWTSLPYVLYESKKLFIYDAVLMDQERILGLNVRFLLYHSPNFGIIQFAFR
jgi:hypothetical protein